MMISFGPSPEEKLVVMIFKDCTHQGRIWFPVLFDVIQNIVKYLCSINRSSLCKQGNRILVTGSEPVDDVRWLPIVLLNF